MSDTNDDTNHYNGVLLEDMNSKLDAVLEGQAAMADLPVRLLNLESDMSEVKTDIKTIRSAIKHQTDQHDRQLKDHYSRAAALEQATA